MAMEFCEPAGGMVAFTLLRNLLQKEFCALSSAALSSAARRTSLEYLGFMAETRPPSPTRLRKAETGAKDTIPLKVSPEITKGMESMVTISRTPTYLTLPLKTKSRAARTDLRLFLCMNSLPI